jgi:hypothetical protein
VHLIAFYYKNFCKVMENYTSLPCLKEHVNPIQNFPLVSLMSILTLSTHPNVGFNYDFFTSIFSPNSCMHSLHTYTFHMPRLLTFLDWITLTFVGGSKRHEAIYHSVFSCELRPRSKWLTQHPLRRPSLCVLPLV